MEAMIKGEMGSVWDRLGKVERTHKPLAPSFFGDKIPLPYIKALLKATIVSLTYDHLDSFCYAIDGQEGNEATKYRLFRTTLKGAALNWFKQLNLESIGSFAQLRWAFLDRYMIISSRLYTATYLSNIRQRKDESQRDYVTHFNKEYSRCEGCDEATAYNALMRGF
ncbi:unnamed protein product [Prunus armeniaca]